MKAQQADELVQSLESRFHHNVHRHEGIAWETVVARVRSVPGALEILGRMEASGGEPDVIGKAIREGLRWTGKERMPSTR